MDRIDIGREIMMLAVDYIIVEAPELEIDVLLQAARQCREQREWSDAVSLADCIRHRVGLSRRG